MRFMMFIYPGIKDEADWTPSAEAVAAMSKYNEELAKAGVLLALDGLHPTSEGARITYEGTTPRVIDGPFAETKEVIGGYWMLQTRSKEEAIEWASRCPAGGDVVLELRRVFEMSDFPPELQAAGELSETPSEQPAAGTQAGS
jgi:hypothetical protein